MTINAAPPIDTEQARVIASQVITADAGGHDFVLMPEQTIERPFGWVFFYTTRKHLETGDPSYAVPGNGPLIVLRANGQVDWLSTALSPQDAVDAYEQAWSER